MKQKTTKRKAVKGEVARRRGKRYRWRLIWWVRWTGERYRKSFTSDREMTEHSIHFIGQVEAYRLYALSKTIGHVEFSNADYALYRRFFPTEHKSERFRDELMDWVERGREIGVVFQGVGVTNRDIANNLMNHNIQPICWYKVVGELEVGALHQRVHS